MNEQNHALSIRSARGTDAGNGKEGRDSLDEVKNEAGRTTDSPLESGKRAQWGGSK